MHRPDSTTAPLRRASLTRLFKAFLLFFITTNCPLLNSQEVSIGVLPRGIATAPLGDWAASYLEDWGGGAGLDILVSFSGARNFALTAGPGYTLIPLRGAEDTLSLIGVGAGARGDLELGDRLTVLATARAVGYYAMLSGPDPTRAPGIGGDTSLGLSFLLSRHFQLVAGARFEYRPDFFNSATITVGVTTRVTGPGSTAIPLEDTVIEGSSAGGYVEMHSIELDPVFPVLYKYYQDNPIGHATVANTSGKPIEDLEIRMEVPQYMDAPILSARINRLRAGTEQDVDIFALFNDDILRVSEGAVLSSTLHAVYRVDGVRTTDSVTVPLSAYDRNAIEWDDDRKVAAFITSRDEQIERYARNVAAMVRDEGLDALSSELQLAMALFGAMDSTGCAYIVDPSSSYLELSRERALDAVQFPRQTLQYRGGDCDDLTTTYAALLESVGIESGFITIPGHILPAFRLSMPTSEARRTFSRPDDLIIDNDEVWIPVEATALQSGFANAWLLGARQWREHAQSGNATLYRTREAWKTYQPVAFSVSTYEIEVPTRESIVTIFGFELERFVDQEIAARERTLLARLRRNPDDVRSRNALGVLYGRFGRTEDARHEFELAADTGHAPALANLGNIALLEGEFAVAIGFYERALQSEPDMPAALFGLTKSNRAIGELERAETYRERLASVAPELADDVATLASGAANTGRASAGDWTQQPIVWEEEYDE